MLTGKIALVTGAGRGIGREIALTLAQYGADVIVNYNGSREKAEEVAEKIRAMGRRAVAVQCSVADFEACGKMIADILAEFGRIDILVNNAGITKDNLMMLPRPGRITLTIHPPVAPGHDGHDLDSLMQQTSQTIGSALPDRCR